MFIAFIPFSPFNPSLLSTYIRQSTKVRPDSETSNVMIGGPMTDAIHRIHSSHTPLLINDASGPHTLPRS